MLERRRGVGLRPRFAFLATVNMSSFLSRHAPRIVGVLSGLDRIRFRGSLTMLASEGGMMSWLWDRGILLKEFREAAKVLTAMMLACVQDLARRAGRQITYLASSRLSKEDLVRELLRREGVGPEGVVAIYSCVEPCRSFEIYKNKETQRLELRSSDRKCLHWYVYFLSDIVGLCHVRIQSWFPFNIDICMNGREWLCRELDRLEIGYTRRDNCLTRVEDVDAAQRILTEQTQIDWPLLLNALAAHACPAAQQIAYDEGALSRYWTAAQTEWAMDVMFRSAGQLADLYPALTRHALTTFSSPHVMRFLGRVRVPQDGGVDPRFNGETDSRGMIRPEGMCVKHFLNGNSVKMYDKAGSVLRIETTINNPADLRTLRPSSTEPEGPEKVRPLRKGVVDLPRRCELSQASNDRYLEALSAVSTPTPLGPLADRLSAPAELNGRRVRGLHLLSGDDAKAALALLDGRLNIRGFRNRDLRDLLYGPQSDAAASRQASGRITRLLRLFRAHKLIVKLPGTHRCQLTKHGREALAAFNAARLANTATLTAAAA